jgi:REP element-mobilizing transposase RayT
MRERRIKISADESAATYHCISRTVNGEFLFGPAAKEVFRRQLWLVAEYCGVVILTYVILCNHFHILVYVPQRTPLDDAELLRRYALLYPKPTKYKAAQLCVIRQQLASNGPEAVKWRTRQLALMNDVSQYMKLLKQRFSTWFNQTHQRFGTLWAERFESILAETTGNVTRTTAAYIDLNGVRAGLALDPKDYRFCGYAEAVAGGPAAQRGLQAVTATSDWPAAQASYRQLLFGTGSVPRPGTAPLPLHEVQRVLRDGGELPLATLLRCRVRYLTAGAVLGSRAFVEAQLVAYRRLTHRPLRSAPHALPPLAPGWDSLATLRSLRRRAFG